jgi:hypothetical protein
MVISSMNALFGRKLKGKRRLPAEITEHKAMPELLY